LKERDFRRRRLFLSLLLIGALIVKIRQVDQENPFRTPEDH
jgi:hypothetical protein